MTDTPAIHVSADAHAFIADALARAEAGFRYVRVSIGRGWSGWSYRLALDESAGNGDVVIDAAGLSFVAHRDDAPMVNGLRLDMEDRHGRKVLVASHSQWAPGGGC